MKNFISTSILTLLLVISYNVTAQDNSQAKTLITSKTPKKTNLLIEKINELTDNDDVLTEQTVLEIRKNQTTKIKRVVADNKFNTLSAELRKEAIKQSEVVAIIKKLKK